MEREIDEVYEVTREQEFLIFKRTGEVMWVNSNVGLAPRGTIVLKGTVTQAYKVEMSNLGSGGLAYKSARPVGDEVWKVDGYTVIGNSHVQKA